MAVWPIEVDGNCIWFSDELIGGLYEYHKLSKKVKCIISPINLYEYNIFRINGIVCWREFIIVCPFFLSCPIIVYSKENKTLKAVHIRGIEKYTMLDCAKKIENTLYLNMYYSDIAVYMLNFDKLCDSQTKEIFPEMISYPDNCLHTVWFAKCFNNIICLPDNGGKKIYCVKEKEISTINLKVPKDIFTINFYQSELWVISIDGWELYRVDQDGKLLEMIVLDKNDFSRNGLGVFHIAATEKYFFLMFHNRRLGCYDRKEHCKVELGICSEDLENLYINELPGTFLFGIEHENKLFIPPYGNRGLQVNLKTLECQAIDVFFPDEFEKNLKYYMGIVRAHKGCNFFHENMEKSLVAYLKYGISNKSMNDFSEHSRINQGRKYLYS